MQTQPEDNNGDSTFEFVDGKESLTSRATSSTSSGSESQNGTKSAITPISISMEQEVNLSDSASAPLSDVITTPAKSVPFHQSELVVRNDPLPTASEDESRGMWGWITGTVGGNPLLNKIVEKAKNSVDSVITTLDPQMKEIIYSGGDIELIVLTDHENEASAVREAFQLVFGRATILSEPVESPLVAQPIGFSAGLQGAEERIHSARNGGKVSTSQPVIALENFIVEITPDRWAEMGCLVLDDPSMENSIHVYTQGTPIPLHIIHKMQQVTPADFDMRWAGLSVKIDDVIGDEISRNPDWRQNLFGVSRKETVGVAAKVLATLYKNRFV